MPTRRRQADQLALDWETPFREHQAELRVKLRSIDSGLVGVSRLRWRQLVEVVMAVDAHAYNRPEHVCEAETADVIATASLSFAISRDQFYAARKKAIELGILVVADRYRGRRKLSNAIEIDLRVIDEMVAASRSEKSQLGPTRSNQVQPGPTRSNYIKESVNPSTLNPKQPSITTPVVGAVRNEDFSGRDGAAPSVAPGTWEPIVEELLALGVSSATRKVAQARANGSTPERVRKLIAHYRAREPCQLGGLAYRISVDSPALPIEAGWPGGGVRKDAFTEWLNADR